MDNITWFKFTPSEWFMGRIQRCPEITQARFIRLCGLYWKNACLLTVEDAEIEIDKEHLDILISKNIVKTNQGLISIKFLDEQNRSIEKEYKVNSDKGKEGNLKRWYPSIYERYINKDLSLEDAWAIAKGSGGDGGVIDTRSPNIAEENRKEEKKNRIEENRKEEVADKSAKVDFKNRKLTSVKSEELKESTTREILAITQAFHSLIGENLKALRSYTKTHENAKYEPWTDPIRLMIERDGVTLEQLKSAFGYLKSSDDEFWRVNIQSTSSLRRNLTKILAKANAREVKKDYQTGL